MMAKAAKYDKLMTELKAKVECPVCLTVPTGGQMLACPNGHLVCSPCRVKMTADGKEDCPVCREPMGNNKSLLAMVVIENMEHECTNTGCKEKEKEKTNIIKRGKNWCTDCNRYVSGVPMSKHKRRHRGETPLSCTYMSCDKVR